MRKQTLIIVSVSTLAVLWWVSFNLAVLLGFRIFRQVIEPNERIVFVTNSNLETEPGIRVLDANNPTFKVLSMEPHRVDVKWENTRIKLKEATCRLKKLDGSLVYVTGRLNDRQYPIIIDTGCGFELVVNDMIVKDNQLEIFPFEYQQGTLAGLCSVEKIEIGEMTITTPPCLYTLNHYEKRVFGRTKWKQRQILFGLGLLHRFRYFLIDNVASQVELSMSESFRADPAQTWQQYPLSVEKSKTNAKKLMVRIIIAGQEAKATLDTGTNWSLTVSQSVWSTLETKLHVLSESRGQAQFFNGWNDINTITVKELNVGEKCMVQTTIVVLADSIFGEDCVIIGMDYFKDTIVVIDFEHNLLWVRKPESL